MATGINLEFDSHHTNRGGYVKGDPWSRDSTDCSSTLVTAKVMDQKETMIHCLKEGDFPECDLVVGAEVVKGDTIYVVWAEYGTGDSFGSDGGNIELIAAYVSEEKANVCAENARSFEQNQEESFMSENRYNLKVVLDDDTEYTFYVPWTGYFESLECVHVDEIILT